VNELLRFIRIGEAGVILVDGDVFFNSAQHTEFGLDADAFLVGSFYNTLRDGHVLTERLMGSVYHHRRIEAGSDAVVTGLLIPVVKVNSKESVREDFIASSNHGLQESLVSVGARPLGDLDHKGRLRVDT